MEPEAMSEAEDMAGDTRGRMRAERFKSLLGQRQRGRVRIVPDIDPR